MRKIDKSNEPESLTDFRLNYPDLKYSDLNDGNVHVRIDIRAAGLIEQHFICCYCNNRISENSCHNEHIIPQKADEEITLDFDNNIIISCNAPFHCGHNKGNSIIDLTPLMEECESEIVYQINGKMTHVTPRAQSTISILNLRNKSLENKRKQIIDFILFQYVDDILELELEDNEYLELVKEEISIPDQNGKLEAFSPVIVNVLNQFIYLFKYYVALLKIHLENLEA